MPVFEVVITSGSRLVLGPVAVVADDSKIAIARAVVNAEEDVDMVDAEVLVRPFCEKGNGT